jgi:hypothetical protein
VISRCIEHHRSIGHAGLLEACSVDDPLPAESDCLTLQCHVAICATVREPYPQCLEARRFGEERGSIKHEAQPIPAISAFGVLTRSQSVGGGRHHGPFLEDAPRRKRRVSYAELPRSLSAFLGLARNLLRWRQVRLTSGRQNAPARKTLAETNGGLPMASSTKRHVYATLIGISVAVVGILGPLDLFELTQPGHSVNKYYRELHQSLKGPIRLESVAELAVPAASESEVAEAPTIVIPTATIVAIPSR